MHFVFFDNTFWTWLTRPGIALGVTLALSC